MIKPALSPIPPVDVLCEGLIPVGLRDGPIPELETVDLPNEADRSEFAEREATTERRTPFTPPVTGPELARLRSSLGPSAAKLDFVWVSSTDPRIPRCLQRSPSKRVCAVVCDREIEVVVTGPEGVAPVESGHPSLRQNLLTSWAGRFVFWIQADLNTEVQNDTIVELGHEAVLILEGLIPVALDEPEWDARIVRAGAIPRVDLAELIREVRQAGHTPPEQSPETGADSPQAQEQMAQASALVAQFQALFGPDHVVERLNANDRRFPPALLFEGDEIGCPPDWNLLGIQCGSTQHSHLVAVLFRCKEAMQEFVNQNPALNQVITEVSSLPVVWLRIQGYVPRNLDAGSLVWFSEGVIPVGLDGRPLVRPLEPGTSIPVAQFREVKWSKETANVFEIDEIAQVCGEPFYPTRPRKYDCNDLFFSQTLLRRLNLIYDLNQEAFRHFIAESGRWVRISEKELRRMVANRLIQLAKDFPEQFPPSEIRPGRVKRLMFLMESLGAEEIPSEEAAVDQYFSQIPEACPGAKLTSQEFYEGHVKFCRVRRWPVCSKACFDRRAAERFGDTGHCYGPYGTQRGRTGWRLKHDLIEHPSVGLRQ
jgi:hypothetical protein